jgi:hypothetical protein
MLGISLRVYFFVTEYISYSVIEMSDDAGRLIARISRKTSHVAHDGSCRIIAHTSKAILITHSGDEILTGVSKRWRAPFACPSVFSI